MGSNDEPAATLRQFFDRYAALSIGPRPEDLAGLYAPTFIVAGPQGSQAFPNDSRFIDWLRSVADGNRQRGMRALQVVTAREMTLSPRHVLAIIRWGARFEKTGDRVIEFEISYLVEKAGDTWQILSYVSQSDEDEEMKKEGLV
jgi:hypothetical protein